jgi:hypothetical protein
MREIWTEETLLAMSDEELADLTEGMIMHRLKTLNMVRQATYTIMKRSAINAAILRLTGELERRTVGPCL